MIARMALVGNAQWKLEAGQDRPTDKRVNGAGQCDLFWDTAAVYPNKSEKWLSQWAEVEGGWRKGGMLEEGWGCWGQGEGGSRQDVDHRSQECSDDGEEI